MSFNPDLITESRRKNALDKKMTPLRLDPEKQTAIFAGSEGGFYHTTLEQCSCADFAINKGAQPCKHIIRLAMELGELPSEGIQSDRDAAIVKYHLGLLREYVKFAPLSDAIAAMRPLIRVHKFEPDKLPDDAFSESMDLPSIGDCPLFKIAKNGKVSIEKKYQKDLDSVITTFKNRLADETLVRLWDDRFISALLGQ